jgi:hypothetical protein
MAFIARDGRFLVVAAFGWERPDRMVLTGMAWANETDSKAIRNLLAGKPELAD